MAKAKPSEKPDYLAGAKHIYAAITEYLPGPQLMAHLGEVQACALIAIAESLAAPAANPTRDEQLAAALESLAAVRKVIENVNEGQAYVSIKSIVNAMDGE